MNRCNRFLTSKRSAPLFKENFTKAIVLLAAVLFPAAVFADNCFINGSSVAVPHPTSDPAPTVFTYNGTTKVYFYCTQDIIGGSGSYPIDTVNCYTSSDMYHWKLDDGLNVVPLYEDQVPWANQTVHKLWAPSVVYLKGLYRLIVPATHTDGYFYNFVATCINPVGPYTAGPVLPGSVRNVIDPFIFIDPDDSTVWLSYRHQDGTNLGFVRMNDSASRVTGDINNCIQNVGAAPSGYREGSWMWKRGTMYYLVFAQVPGSGNEIIAYSTATSYNGPWTYRGQIFAQNNSPSEFTIHSGACEFKGQTYINYHNITFGGQIFGSERCSGWEYLTYNASTGLINTSTISKTNRGVGVPKAYMDSIQVDRGVLAGGCASAAWAYNAATTEARASWYITNIANNASVRYDSVDFTPTAGNAIGTVQARVASTNANNTIQVRLGSTTGTLLGTIAVPNTGTLTTWMTTMPLTLTTRPPAGVQNLVLVFGAGTASTMNVNWVKFGQVAVGVKSNSVRFSSTALSYARMNKNAFTVNVPNGCVVSGIRLFDLTGQEIANAFGTSTSGTDLTVSLHAGMLASGSYVLTVKSGKGELHIPFTY